MDTSMRRLGLTVAVTAILLTRQAAPTPLAAAGQSETPVSAAGRLARTRLAGALRDGRPSGLGLSSAKRYYVDGRSAGLLRAEPPTFALRATVGKASVAAAVPSTGFATYLGSSMDDRIVALEVNAAGETYVFGVTPEADTFPTTNVAGVQASSSPEKCFVAKFDATGSTLLYSVIFRDTAAVTSAGYGAFCDAMTLSPNGVVHAVHQSADLGTFTKTLKSITELPSGEIAINQTRLIGLEGFLPVHAVKADLFENLYVLGGCYNSRVQAPAPSLPGGFRTAPHPGHCVSQDNFFSLGPSESVLIQYDAGGAILYGTFIGGSNDDHTAATALSVSNVPGFNSDVFVAGRTASTDLFPVPPDTPGLSYVPYQASCATADVDDPCADGFFTWISTINVGAASHRYSTYLGGAAGADRITALTFHATTTADPNVPATSTSYRLYVAGTSESASFPRTVPVIFGHGAFAAAFDLPDAQLVYSTTFGGSGSQVPSSIAVFRRGEIAIAGGTDSTDFPLADPLFTAATGSGACPAEGCAFVTVLSPAGDAMPFSTYLDDSGMTSTPRIAGDRFGSLFVGATTTDYSLATPGAYKDFPAGGADVLVMKIDEAVAAPVNQPPEMNPVSNLVVNAASPEGAEADILVLVNDPEFDQMTVTFTGPLNSVERSPFAGGFLIGRLRFPIGTNTVTVTADDGHGGTATRTAQVTVLGAVVNGTGTVEVAPQATFNNSLLYWSRLNPLFEPTVRVKLEHVSGPGVVTLNIRTNVATPPVPAGYQLGSPPYYYDIASTAAAAGPFTVCIDTTGMSFAADRSTLRLSLWNGSEWTNITTAPNGNSICGLATGLGTFAIFQPANPENAATTIAGSGHSPGSIDGPGGDPGDDIIDGGQATASSLFAGQGGLAFDAQRRLLYTTTFAGIRRVNLDTGIMDTIGGDGALGEFFYDPLDGASGVTTTDNVDARSAHITNPNQLALDPQGNLYIAEFCRVRRIDRQTNIITTVAGDGFCRHRGDGGPATAASLGASLALVIDTAGNLLIGENGTPAGFIRRVDAITGIITTVVGNGLTSLVTPGPALASGFPSLSRMALAPNGDIYATYYGNTLLRITPGSDGLVNGGPGENVSVVNSCAPTGCPAQKFRGDNGPVTLAEFRHAYAVTVEPNGDVLIADGGDARIRRISAGADGVVTGAPDETIVTVAGHNPGDSDGFNMVNWAHAEDYGLSAWVGTAVWDVIVDPRGGFIYINGNSDLVRRVGGQAVSGPAANLSVSARVSPEVATLNNILTYRLTVRNAGPAAATAVTLTMPALPGATILGALPDAGSCTAPASGPVSCDLGSIASGAQTIVTITARADALGTLTASFQVSAPETDPNPANNTVTSAIEVVQAADLSVAILAPSEEATLNLTLPVAYDLVMSNNGPDAAFTARLRYELPAGVAFVSAAMPGGLCTFEFGAVVCDIDGLGSGATARATIVVRPTVEGRVTSTFTASAPLIDLVPTNNTATVSNRIVLLPAVIDVAETVFVMDSAPVSPATHIAVAETVLVHDSTPVTPAPMIAVAETVFVADSPSVLPARTIAVSEQIVVTDVVTAPPQPILTVLPPTATSTIGTTHTVTAIANTAGDPNARVVISSTVGDVRVQFANPGVPDSPLSITVLPGNPMGGSDIIVSLSTDSAGVLSSTAAHVVAGINATPAAAGLVTAAIWSGAAGTGIVQPRPLAPLTRIAFSITGTTTRTESCFTTLPGRCAISYSSTTAGTDAIAAFLDLDGDGARDSGEPAGGAEKVWTGFIGVPVPIGVGVIVPLVSLVGVPVPVTLTFGNVTQAGVATGTPLGAFPPLPFDFLLKSTVYDVVTTAQYNPPVTVCFLGAFAAIDRLMHFEGGVWRDVTASRTPTQICGTVLSLSPFAVMEPPNHAPSADAGGNRTIEATTSSGASVTLAGTGADADPGDELVFQWSEGAVVLATTATATLPLGLGEHTLTLTVTDLRGASASSVAVVNVRDTTPPVLTLPSDITVTATSAAGAAVSFTATATDLVSGSVDVTCTPSSGATFPVGQTSVSCTAVDGRTNRSTGTFKVTVQPASVPPALSRFVALGIDQVWLRSGSRALTGDVGANRAMPGIHLPWNPDDASDPDLQIEVIVGLNAGVVQPGSRVVGDTVWLRAGASVVDVIENELIRSRFAKVSGKISTPATLPLVQLPAFPAVSAGATDVIVRRDRTVTLPPGRYRRIQIERRGTLILSGGLYQVQSIDLDEQATILARGVTELRVKSELDGESGVRLLVDSSQPGLGAASFTIFVEGSDAICVHDGFGPDGDSAGPTAVHIGADSQVQANIYAPNGTVWLKARSKATGAFIGRRVRIGDGVTLRLDSAFK